MKISKKNVIASTSRVGGGLAGAIASDYATDFLSEKIDATGNSKKYVQGGLVVASILASSLVAGATPDKQFVKGTFEGMAIKQGAELVANLIMPETTPKTSTADTDGRFALSGSLGCGCSENKNYMLPAYEQQSLGSLLTESNTDVPFGSLKTLDMKQYLG